MRLSEKQLVKTNQLMFLTTDLNSLLCRHVLCSLNKLSNSVSHGLNSDYRGIAKLTGNDELDEVDSLRNPMALVMEAWLEKSPGATLLDLFGLIAKIGRMDVYRGIDCGIGRLLSFIFFTSSSHLP